MSGEVFDGIAAFYDLVYAGKDTEAEAGYVSDRLAEQGLPPDARLLEWGSGTGRHARALAARGYRVTGVERSPQMLARSLAASPQGEPRFLAGDLLDPSPGGPYDAVLACFHVISYLPETGQLARAFANARQALRPGGVFLFDVWHGPAVLAQLPETRCARFADADRELTRIATPRHDVARRLIDVGYLYFHRRRGETRWALDEETHRLRYWFPEEIAQQAQAAGLRHVLSEEWLSRQPASVETWGVCHVLTAV